MAMHFDAAFVTRLQQRDPDACTYLVSSLTPLLEAKLRYKFRDHSVIDDNVNETFYRVFCLVDAGRVREPEHLGWFVRGVCDRVAQESCRKAGATEPLPGGGLEPLDRQPQADKLLVAKERRDLVWRAIMKLPEADRKLLVEMHWEERDRREMARERGISNTVLNVRLCRALKRLRERVLLQDPAANTACRPGALGAQKRWATMAA
jgi:RNA polymerase sigma factor (sigma-70 family)